MAAMSRDCSYRKVLTVHALKKREEQRLEAAQMKFLRHLLGITKLDKEKKPLY